MSVISQEPTKRERILFRMRLKEHTLRTSLFTSGSNEQRREILQRIERLHRTKHEIDECK